MCGDDAYRGREDEDGNLEGGGKYASDCKAEATASISEDEGVSFEEKVGEKRITTISWY